MKEDRRARTYVRKVTVSEWIDRWLATQDVGPSTVDTREYLIRRFIRPAWARYELGSLSSEEITAWENAIPARTGVSQRVARDARSLLATILGDAAAATTAANPRATRRSAPGTAAGVLAGGLSAARRRCGPRRCRHSWPPSALPC